VRGPLRHLGQQGLRVVLLVAVVAASGVGLGLAAGYPVSRVQFEQSDSVRLDQSRLAGEVDPAAAVLTQADLPIGWEPGDPALAGFTLLGGSFCGEDVVLPTALSAREAVVFANPTEQAFVVSEAVRLDRWQSARSYVDALDDAVGSCEAFFRTGLDGSDTRLSIRPDDRDAPITDHVARIFVSEDGSSVQAWSVMAVGDVVVALSYTGPARPQEGFLRALEDRILVRVDPLDFAPGGVPLPDDVTGVTDPDEPGGTTGTTVLDGGAADETDTLDAPVDAGGGEPPG
jgi:hypothetical protein